MNAYDYLWDYQQKDLELDQCEAKIKASPTRKKLVKLRNFLVEQQNALAQMEKDIQESQQWLSEAQKQLEELYGQAKDLNEVPQTDDVEELVMVQSYCTRVQKLVKNIEISEGQLQSLGDRIEQMNQQYQTMRVKVPKAKKDYTLIKEEYDQELKADQAQAERVRSERDKIGEKIEKKLLERYHNIKYNRADPLARVVNEQCSGCNMEIAALALRKIKDAEQIVECENCGRILYLVG